MAVTAGPLDANTRGTPLASEDGLALASLFKAYTISATFWLLFATAVGLLLAFKFGAPDFWAAKYLTFGRLRPIHTNGTFCGFASIALVGAAYYVTADFMGLAAVAEETTSWPYRHDRDLTGFVDGSENPALVEAPEVVGIPEGKSGAGGTVLLLQKWIHDSAQWESLSVHEQEQAMGRTKADSIELKNKPATSHVARTDQDSFGHAFRRNMPFGTITRHGTMFVGFCAEQRSLAAMLESMAGVTDGVRDALTRYTHPLTGQYYFVLSTEHLREMGIGAS